MNSENLLRVADAIEKHEIAWLGFNMVEYADDEGHFDRSGHNCGTTACIAGWSVAVQNNISTAAELLSYKDILSAAQHFLGLSRVESNTLFMGYYAPRDVTPPQDAVRTLRYAAKHHVINWYAANAEPVE